MLKEGRILEKGWDNYTLWDVVASPRSMTVQELEDGLLGLYRTISDPRNAQERLCAILRQRRTYAAKRGGPT